MQTTERPPTAHRPARSASPVRGVVLVAVAVVIGFFVLRALDDTGAGPSGVTTSPSASEPAAEGGDGGEAATETTAAPEARAPTEVVVLVANASGVNGAAGEQTTALQGGGYQVLPADNAPNQVETTQVLPTAGYEAEADVLAALIGAGEDAVQPMPDEPPVQLDGANILVLLGPDLANG
jgi:LytR cell envelope-related transcriptional attenuator